MQAVVLAGGFGTRLAPLTYTRPKPLLPILNKPMMQHLVEALPPHTQVILATNYKTQMIEEHFRQMGRPIVINEEPRPLGTGGATKFAEEYLEGTFLVLNSDILSSLNFRKFIQFHRENKALATISLWPVENVQEFGVADVQPDGRITSFVEKPRREDAPSNLINAGAYCLEPEVLDYIPPDKMVSMEQEIFPKIIGEGRRFYGYPLEGFWIDVGRPASYLKANLTLMKRRDVSQVVGTGSRISGQLHQACVGRDCMVAEEAQVSSSVLYDRVTVEEGARLDICIVGEGCTVGSHARLSNMVVGDGETIDDRAHLENTAVWTRPRPEGYPDRQIGNPVKEQG